MMMHRGICESWCVYTEAQRWAFWCSGWNVMLISDAGHATTAVDVPCIHSVKVGDPSDGAAP